MSPEPSTENPALAAGIDFGGTSVKIGVCQGDTLVAKGDPIPTDNYKSAEDLIDAMVDQIQALCDAHPGVATVGAGVPGFVDFKRGFVHDLTNVPTWVNVPFAHILTEKTGLAAVVDNDANCMAYAEWRYGSAAGRENVIALTLGTGIGGGLILDGKLYRGSQFGAGEIGQMSIDYRGKAGEYGNTGAAEKYVGNAQIEEHAILKYANLGIAKSREECTPKAIAQAAQAGDEIARQIWGDVANWLGTVVSSIVWLLNPDAIVIGGGVSRAGKLLFDPLEKKLTSMLSPVFWENLEILPAKFGNDAGIIGSAALARDASVEGDAANTEK